MGTSPTQSHTTSAAQESQRSVMWPKTSTNESEKRSFPIRIVIAVLGVAVCLLMCSTRYNLPVAMVSMVHDSCTPNTSICGDQSMNFFEPQMVFEDNQTQIQTETHLYSFYSPPRKVKQCDSTNDTKKHLLPWDEVKQGIVLGVYYYGFIATSIFGGRLAEKSPIGPKWIVAFGLGGSAIFNAILPLLAFKSFNGFIIVRILIGACHGVILPSLFFLFQNWFPKREQTSALSCLLVGTVLGLVLNVPIVSIISDLDVFDGWPLLFYGGSFLHIFWFGLWWYFVTDSPESHTWVPNNEIDYIRQNSHHILEEKLNSAPWMKIIKSKTLYASIVAKFCWSFNHAIIIDNGPSYLNRVAGSNWFQASVYIALVYLLTAIVYFVTGPIFTILQPKSSLSLTRLRKLFQTFVFLGAATTMFLMPVVKCSEQGMVALIATNMAFQGLIAGGEFPMLIEYSGNYAGTVYGIVSVFESIARISAPFIRGELVRYENTLDNWNKLFFITAILNVVGMIIFEICADAKLQSWAVKKEIIRELSDDGQVTNVKLDKASKRIVLHEVQHNPHFRLPLNTESDDWKDFKVFTLVQ